MMFCGCQIPYRTLSLVGILFFMASDPAFLFYTNDFDSKTKFFSHEQVGKYLRLLIAQHQHGHLTEKQVIHICGNFDDEIMEKFTKDESGKFFNQRLDVEITKRKSFSESRRKNLIKSQVTSQVENHMAVHMDNHMEIENEIEIDNRIKKEKTEKKFFKAPSKDEVILFFKNNGFPDSLAVRMWSGYEVSEWKDSKGKPIRNWKQKAIHVWFRSENKIQNGTTDKTGRIETNKLTDFINNTGK